MKKTTLLLILLCCCLGIAYAQSEGKPAISFATKSHDFGNINEEKGTASCQFTFTNTGTAPLVIISATAPCGCTKPYYPDEPIQPGKSATIDVTYNPKNRPGEFNKNVTVRTNDPKHKRVVLKISGNVIPKK